MINSQKPGELQSIRIQVIIQFTLTSYLPKEISLTVLTNWLNDD